jgi:hypothetical protein
MLQVCVTSQQQHKHQGTMWHETISKSLCKHLAYCCHGDIAEEKDLAMIELHANCTILPGHRKKILMASHQMGQVGACLVLATGNDP